MEYFARAVDAVLSEAHISKAALVGHRMGTNVILQYLRSIRRK
jgi:pimeloyl-ACP methyl ester carboxylesterase